MEKEEKKRMTDNLGPHSALSPIEAVVHALFERHRGTTEGRVADYIPELSRADPSAFGICIATRDGHVYEIGDSRQHFTIQSISKALVYGLALQDRGEAAILGRIGVEPSGDAFNAISLREGTGAPFNPMINAGAIAACGLLRKDEHGERISRVLQFLSGFAGRTLDVDEAVYLSESETGHRNRAIGWMLRNFGIIDEDPTYTLETYFRQCAVRVTCRDLALMAATLANHGLHPVTGQVAVAPEYVRNILSVMSTCGMYDASGAWIYRVGLPAKSGVGGGVMAVLPGQLGIGVFSPPLDTQGNSVRGVRVCEDLSRELSLHMFQAGGPLPSLRLSYDAGKVRSRRRRSAWQRELLAQEGHRVRVMELQGDLVFGSVEPVVRAAHEQSAGLSVIVLDLRNVVAADQPSLRMLAQLQQSLAGRGLVTCFCNARALGQRLVAQGLDPACLKPDIDMALESAEELLLSRDPRQSGAGAAMELADCELVAPLEAAELAWLDARMAEKVFRVGEAVLKAGDPGDAMFFLLEGAVEVRLASSAGRGRRVDVFTAGMSFGEMAFIDGAPRSADVVAILPSRCRVLPLSVFESLDTEWPQLKIRLLQQVTRQLSANLRRINAEVLAIRG